MEFGYVCGRTYGLEDRLDGSWLRVWTHVTWLTKLDKGLDKGLTELTYKENTPCVNTYICLYVCALVTTLVRLYTRLRARLGPGYSGGPGYKDVQRASTRATG